jgi:hypothetical protein
MSAYPSQEAVLLANPLFDWIDQDFLRNDPYAFQGADFQKFIFTCSQAFGVDPNGVLCTGSGAVGLSLNPEKIEGGRLKVFGRDSDLDIALISEVHFEQAWRSLRAQAHPAVVSEMESGLTGAISHQKKRFFDGAILTNKLLPYLEFGAEWQRSHVKVEESAALALGREVEVNYWIYRDYWSVRSYVANSIVKCRKEIA